MDIMEIQPQDALRAGETTEQVETRALDTATFEPGDHLEQTGDFRQAEAIQTSLETVMTSLTAERIPDGMLPLEPVPVDASQAAPVSEGEPGGERAIPISIPSLQDTAGEEIGFKFFPKEPGGSAEIPLPGQVKEPDGMVEAPLPGTADEIACDGSSKEPAYQIGHKEPGGTAEVPLPSPEAETGLKFDAPETAGSAEVPLPGTAVETGWKLNEGDLPTPLPSPALEGVRLEEATIDQIVARTQAVVEKMSEESNPQFLLLEQQLHLQSQTYSMLSNILKPFSDSPDDAIKNIR